MPTVTVFEPAAAICFAIGIKIHPSVVCLVPTRTLLNGAGFIFHLARNACAVRRFCRDIQGVGAA